jgi:hypothetical protein
MNTGKNNAEIKISSKIKISYKKNKRAFLRICFLALSPCRRSWKNGMSLGGLISDGMRRNFSPQSLSGC